VLYWFEKLFYLWYHQNGRTHCNIVIVVVHIMTKAIMVKAPLFRGGWYEKFFLRLWLLSLMQAEKVCRL